MLQRSYNNSAIAIKHIAIACYSRGADESIASGGVLEWTSPMRAIAFRLAI